MEKPYYLLKISLRHIEPEIMRRFVVPASITLDRLHDVIQIVMGWQDSHLYNFTIGRDTFMEFPEEFDDVAECGKFRLADLVEKQGTTFSYLYDFGDNWEHELTLEHNDCLSFFAPEDEIEDFGINIGCIEGTRACPPEDVGSVPGYYEFCEAMKKPRSKAYKEYKEWYASHGYAGEEYDSEAFDLEVVNMELQIYLRYSRDRTLPWEEQK